MTFFDDGKSLLGMAISTRSRALYIDCASWRASPASADATCALLHTKILTTPDILCVGFNFCFTAIAIRKWFNKDVTGIDVAVEGDRAQPPVVTVKSVFGGLGGNYAFPNLQRIWSFNSDAGNEEDHGAAYGSLKAWLALACGTHHSRLNLVQESKELDTRRIGQEVRSMFLFSRLDSDVPNICIVHSKSCFSLKPTTYSPDLKL